MWLLLLTKVDVLAEEDICNPPSLLRWDNRLTLHSLQTWKSMLVLAPNPSFIQKTRIRSQWRPRETHGGPHPEPDRPGLQQEQSITQRGYSVQPIACQVA